MRSATRRCSGFHIGRSPENQAPNKESHPIHQTQELPGSALTEALYDAPFYWMGADKTYEQTAMKHRCLFTEEFTAERLRHVFGAANVFCNVDLWKTAATKEKLAEIDILVTFADRAIIAQAKSKRLTLLARKGNDLQLQKDFKGAVQDACDQAQLCSEILQSGPAFLADAQGNEIKLPAALKQIQPVCVVADHYPALSFQARQFLKVTPKNGIAFPLVCDVFFIDVVSEFLDTPLRFLSYLELRAKAADNLMLSHEITALAFHLKQNLWLGEYDVIQLHDDIATDVNIAMATRRDGVDGRRTPPGILTLLQGTTVGRIIADIEKKSDPAAVGIGLELLKLSSEGANDLSLAIDAIAKRALADGQPHNISIAGSKPGFGITIHCNTLPDAEAASNLKSYCELRKYRQKAERWCGIVMHPMGALRFGLVLEFPWQQDDAMGKATANMRQPEPMKALRKLVRSDNRRRKLGRNDPCHCGSGIKYKKCHLPADEGRG